jgi:hypothetical protein
MTEAEMALQVGVLLAVAELFGLEGKDSYLDALNEKPRKWFMYRIKKELKRIEK